MPRLQGGDFDDLDSETKEIMQDTDDGEEFEETVTTPQQNGGGTVSEEEHEDDEEEVGDLEHEEKPEIKETTAGSDEEDDAEVYEVETIRNHKKVKGKILYQVKWRGYKEAENTWEPESNILPSARQALADYHKAKGLDPTSTPASTKSKKAKENPLTTRRKNSEVAADDSDSNQPPTKKSRSAATLSPVGDGLIGTWVPKGDDWEKHVKCIEGVERDAKTDLLFAFVQWNNGKKSKVGISRIHEKAPRPLIKFYEDHL